MAQEKVTAEPFPAALSDQWDCDPTQFKSAAQVLPSPPRTRSLAFPSTCLMVNKDGDV